MLQLAFTLVDLDGLDGIDPVLVIVLMIALVGLSVSIGAVVLANLLDGRRGRA